MDYAGPTVEVTDRSTGEVQQAKVFVGVLAAAPRLGRISKMGQQDLRRLLVTGAMAVVRQTTRCGDHGSVAGRDVGAQAEESGGGSARQQDGATGLGAGNEEGDLPASRCRLSGP